MKQHWLTLLASVFLSLGGSALAENASLKPYQTGDWKSIAKAANGAPIVIHFWGVTYPACIKEMPQWGHFVKNNPNAKVVFIQVDDISVDSIKKMLIQKLQNALIIKS